MITKEQALTADSFIQVADYKTEQRMGYGCALYRVPVDMDNPIPLPKPVNWRRNGKTKVWKSADRAEHFRIPVKHGLYSYGYIEYSYELDNRQLFEVMQ